VSEDSALPKKTVTYFAWYMKLARNDPFLRLTPYKKMSNFIV